MVKNIKNMKRDFKKSNYFAIKLCEKLEKEGYIATVLNSISFKSISKRIASRNMINWIKQIVEKKVGKIIHVSDLNNANNNFYIAIRVSKNKNRFYNNLDNEDVLAQLNCIFAFAQINDKKNNNLTGYHSFFVHPRDTLQVSTFKDDDDNRDRQNFKILNQYIFDLNDQKDVYGNDVFTNQLNEALKRKQECSIEKQK